MRNGRYVLIHLHRHGDREIWRHREREIWRWREAIHPDAYLSGLSGVCRLSVGWLVGSLWFGSLWFVSVVRLIGSDFDLHKKIF